MIFHTAIKDGYPCALPADGVFIGAENIFQTTSIKVDVNDMFMGRGEGETTVQGWMNSPGHGPS
jgi:hypothetical protein